MGGSQGNQGRKEETRRSKRDMKRCRGFERDPGNEEAQEARKEGGWLGKGEQERQWGALDH